MLKTLKRKIALVAVAGLGFGLVSTVPANAAGAAIVADNLNLTAAGSTLAVTAAGGADTAAARAGVQTIVITEAAAVEADSDYNVLVSSAANAAAITDANTVVLSSPTFAGTNASTGALSVAGAGVQASGWLTSANKVLIVAGTDGNANTTTVKFNTAALTAGTTYGVYVDTTPATNAGGTAALTAADTIKIGSIVVQQSGAPTTVAFNHAVGETQVITTATNRTWTASLKDAAGRSTFLVGDETIQYAWSTVAAGVTALPAVAARTAVFPTIADTTGYGAITAYDLTVNTTTGGSLPTVGNVYTLNATIQSGLNAFGSDSATYRHLTSTSGLATTISIIDVAATTLAGADTDATSATFAVGDASTTDYDFKIVDSVGAVVTGVTPTIASALSNAVTITVSGDNGKGDLGYTATNAGSDTVTLSIAGGSAGTSSKTFAITVGSTYASALYTGAWEATPTAGGKKEIKDTADADLSSASDNYAMYLDPATVASLAVTFNVTLTTGATAVSAAPIALTVQSTLGTIDADVGGATPGTGNVNTTFDTAYNGGTLVPSSLRTATAQAATDASGNVKIDIAFTAPRNGEGFTVVAKSGSTTLGRAAFFFQTAAVTAATVSAGPAQAITQKAGTSTAAVFTVTDQYGNAVAAGKRVGVTVVGPSAPAGGAATVLTDATGKATYTIAGTSAAAGQTDTVTLASYEGGALTAEADDVVAVTYSSATPDVASITPAYGITQAGTYDAITTTFTTVSATATPTVAITAAYAALAGTQTAAIWLDSTALPIDTLGDFVGTTTVSGAADATEDEVVDLRWTVKNSAGSALAGIEVTITASEGAYMVGSLGTAVASRTIFTNASGQVTVRAFGTKTGTAKFTAKAGTLTSDMSWDYANDPADARIVSITPTLSAAAGAIGNLIVTIKDRFGNVVPGVTATYTEVGSGRLEANSGASDSKGTVTLDFISAVTETGTSTVTAAIAAGTAQEDDKAAYVGGVTTATTDGTNGVPSAPAAVKSASATVTLSAAAAVANPALDAVKSDVKAVSDTVATLSKAVTTIQSSVTELTTSFTAQIKSLSSAIAKISRAIAALSKKIK